MLRLVAITLPFGAGSRSSRKQASKPEKGNKKASQRVSVVLKQYFSKSHKTVTSHSHEVRCGCLMTGTAVLIQTPGFAGVGFSGLVRAQ